MKEKEFNLSEKEITDSKWGIARVYPRKDVKEFIQRLKENIKHMSVDDSMDYYDNCNYADFEEAINKLAGPKLIEGKGK